MATINPTITEIQTRGDRGHIVRWGPFATGDVGAALSMVGSTKRTVQLVGTFAGAAQGGALGPQI